jgi:uncharacterized protein
VGFQLPAWFRSRLQEFSSASSATAWSRARYGHSDHEPLDADACARLGRFRTSSPNFGAELVAVCFDSSALVKLLVEESGSEVAARLWDEADTVVTSRLAFPEVSAALAAARRSHRLRPADERRARRSWEDLWSGTRVIELTDAVAAEAAGLAEQFVLGGADAVHLASAMAVLDMHPILAAWDLRLRAAALDAGLRLAPADI